MCSGYNGYALIMLHYCFYTSKHAMHVKIAIFCCRDVCNRIKRAGMPGMLSAMTYSRTMHVGYYAMYAVMTYRYAVGTYSCHVCCYAMSAAMT